MSPPFLAAAERWIVSAALNPPQQSVTSLLADTHYLLTKWSNQFGAQAPVGILPGATLGTLERIDAVIGCGRRA